MSKEYLTSENSKTVRLSRANIETIEDMNKSLDIDSVNDWLNVVMRPIAHGLRKARSRAKEKGEKWNISFELTDKTVTITFVEKVKGL